MINWINAILDRRSRSELLDQIAAQQDLIRHLMSRPVQQLAKLAWRLHDGQASPDFMALANELDNFAEAHADTLRCLEDVNTDCTEGAGD